MQTFLPAIIAGLTATILAGLAWRVMSPTGASLPGRRQLPALLGAGFGVALVAFVLLLTERLA